MKNVNKYIFMLALALLLFNLKTYAHDPLYGHGPHVLYKGGFAPGIIISSGLGFIVSRFELEYGVTSSWTIAAEIPFNNQENKLQLGGYAIKSKYRFYTEFEHGAENEIAALGSYEISNGSNGINALNLGLTGGRESITFYWFASALYKIKFSPSSLKPGNEINYDFTVGYRPFEINYYKPDLVIFLEFLGRYRQKTILNSNTVDNSGGNAWAVAPTFMLTYHNYALRAGIEFGVADNGFINKPETNFKIGFEAHL